MKRNGEGEMEAIVVEGLRKQFDPPKGPVAVNDVSFEIQEGEVFRRQNHCYLHPVLPTQTRCR